MYDDIYSVVFLMLILFFFIKEFEEIYDELYYEEGNDDIRNFYDNLVC